MAIQIRRGAASDFDATKMVSGELAVSTDGTHKVWATGAAGDAWELANKDDLDTVEENLGDVEEDVADLKDAYEQIEADKADTDGTYPDMTVGMAEQLDSDVYTEDSEPYHFRKSGGGNVRVGDRKIDRIVGGTVAWNQLITPIATGSRTLNGITFVSDGNGATVVSGTATANTLLDVPSYPTYILGHKYLLQGCPSGGANNKYSLRYNSNGHGENGGGTILEATASSATLREIVVGSAFPRIFVSSGTEISGSIKFVPQVIDLTAAFGSTIADYIYSIEQSTAGAGVAFLRRYIDIDTYHPYDAGTLKSVEGLVSHDMVGFNQWDEEWESGQYNVSHGGKTERVDAIRCKSMIPVMPNTTYYLHCGSHPSTSDGVWLWYGIDGNYIGYVTGKLNKEQTSPSDAYFMTFYIAPETTYNHDICINLSDPAKNGTYEPYEKHSYPLDSDVTLCGVYKLVDGKLVADGDEYWSTGEVPRRYGVVDLGSLTWDLKSGASGVFYSWSLQTVIKTTSNAIIIDNCICPKLITAEKSFVYDNMTIDNAIAAGYQGGVYIRITSCTTKEEVISALSGVMLVYELQTPTTETAEPFTSPQWVDGSGTEQYISTSLVPIGHYTQYPEDLKSKIEGLPWDFASLIAPTEATYKATQNYTSGSLLIVNNILYKTTAAIANGGNITPGTNCTQTTLAAVIAAL